MKVDCILIFFMCFLASCASDVELSICNETQEIVEVTIISNEFQQGVDTVKDKTSRDFFVKGVVFTPHKFRISACEFFPVANQVTPPIHYIFTDVVEEICYESYEVGRLTNKLTFSLPANTEIPIFYERYIELEGSDLSSVDSILIQYKDIHVELLGANKVKESIRNGTKYRGRYQVCIKDLIE